MASSAPVAGNETDIESYRLHVSQRYLDLTKRKLEQARLPRDLPPAEEAESVGLDRNPPQWDAGVPKAELEAVLDIWLETYDHRAMEEQYNSRLPQFRCKSLNVPPSTLISPSTSATGAISNPTSAPKVYRNIHFVHRQTNSNEAIPLLIIPPFGSSFLEVARVIESLADPITTPTPQTVSSPESPSFHVVCASVPGFGFSDAASDPDFGLDATADVLAALMSALGYQRFIITADTCAFLVARALALRHAGRCIAIHTAGVHVPQPQLRHAPWTWLCYHIARLSRASIPSLSFGYVPSDFTHPPLAHPHHSQLELLATTRTQTYAYAIADSPTGLLALIVDIIGPCALDSLRPSLGAPIDDAAPQSTVQRQRLSIQNAWSPAEVLLWTMMYWLPGPEAPLRWLRNVCQDAAPQAPLWRTKSNIPLGISVFGGGGGGGTSRRELRTPPAWAMAWHDVRWVRRHVKETRRAIWEAPEDFVLDLRDFARMVVA